MTNLPQAIRVQPVPNGIEVIAVGRTERGTKYFMESVVISPMSEDREVNRNNISAAVAQLLRNLPEPV
ncbi:MAG: hypothetical protein KAJ55_17705 [Anaerolineales bacterium]|nr:hypothetical protein [Anaerolineales bacterium]